MKQLIKLLMLLLCSVTANAQLFTAITDVNANLTTEEQEKLDLFRAKPEIDFVQMVNVGNVFDEQQNGFLPVSIPGYQGMTAQLFRLETSSPDHNPDEFVWEGSFTGTVMNENNEEEQTTDGSIELIKKDGEIYGFIHPYNSTDVYELASLAPGKNALIKYAEGAYTTAHECATEATDETFTDRVTGPCNTTVKILVVYSHWGKVLMFNNPNNVINQAMSDLNGAVYNSASSTAGLNFVLAGTYELSPNQFTETPLDTKRTLDSLASNATVKYLRNLYMADIVIGLVGIDKSTERWGRSHIGTGDPTLAYGIVDAFHVNGFYTFSHEVGHIMGARHQTSDVYIQDADDSGTDEHGYSWVRGWPHNKRYYEIMHRLTDGYHRQHMYSTPTKQIFGHDMGTYSKNNATKRLLDNACTVSEYRNDNILYFNATLNSVATAHTNQIISLTTTPVNGIPSFTFEWYYSQNGGISYNYITTTTGYFGSTIQFAMPNAPNAIIWVKATSAANEVKTLTKTITNTSYLTGGNNCCNFPLKPGSTDTTGPQTIHQIQNRDLTVTPNPATSTTLIHIDTHIPASEMTGKETIIITDLYGKKLHEQKLAGQPSIEINNLYLPSGTYFVQFTGTPTPATRKLIITK